MSDGPLRSRAVRGLAVAVAGLFAGHLLVYRIVAPNALQRALLLAGTGHAYLPVALALGVILAAVGAGVAFTMGFRRARGLGAGRGRMGLAGALVVPAISQALAFLALEVLERALAGVPMGTLLGPLLPVGVALQLIVGAAGGLMLAGLDRAGEIAGREDAPHRPRVRRETELHRWPSATPCPKPPQRPCQLIRGPPVPA